MIELKISDQNPTEILPSVLKEAIEQSDATAGAQSSALFLLPVTTGIEVDPASDVVSFSILDNSDAEIHSAELVSAFCAVM